jgi:predicted AlkP superfamily pyrophosphatase or phosphodiesterase
MIHHNLVNTIRQKKERNEFLYPYYNGYSLNELVASIVKGFGVSSTRVSLPFKELLEGSNKNKKVVFFLIDGFGYSHYIRYYKNYSFFERFAKKGNVYPLTSVFPSTTPAALTTLHTGLTPQEHGLPEWTVYFEEFDSIIETLPFKTWEMTNPDGLLKTGGSYDMLYTGPTVYEHLQKHGIKSYMFVFEHYGHSAYSKAVHRGSTVVPFKDGLDLISKLRTYLLSQKGPAYYFVYWGNIDSIAHRFGPESREHEAAIASFSELMETEFLNSLKKEEVEDVTLMFSADHGHAGIRGDDIINLNKYPEIDDNFMRSPQGKRILPTGSPHDVFLFIQPGKVKPVMSFLKDELIGKATILNVQEAVDQELFGINKHTPRFMKRIGNVIILPYDKYHIWYEFLPDKPYGQLGIHGGLSEEEMLIPLAIAPMSALVEE